MFKDAFFYWEISSYTYFYIGLNSEKRKEVFSDFYNLLATQVIEENIATETNGIMLDDIIHYFNCGGEIFYHYLEKRAVEKEIMVNSFKNIKTKEKVILFGMGHFGRLIYQYLKMNDIDPILMDNDIQKQKDGYKGKKIHIPHKVEGDNAYYIVANIQYANIMAKQIIEAGVCENDILLCQDENRFIREVLGDAN